MRLPFGGDKSVNSTCCCHQKSHVADEARPQKPWLRRAREVAGWILPGALLALMPKCPLCLAAYVALCTGCTMSGAVAHVLLRTLTVLCLGTLAVLVFRRVVICFRKKQQFNLQSNPTHS